MQKNTGVVQHEAVQYGEKLHDSDNAKLMEKKNIANRNMRFIFWLMAGSVVGSFLFEKTKDTIEVDVMEVLDEESYRRTKRGAGMAKHKKFEFVLDGRKVMLNLTLNDLVRDDAPMYLLQDGKTTKCKRASTDEQYGFYQDQQTQSSVMVKCMKDVCKPCVEENGLHTRVWELFGRVHRKHTNEVNRYTPVDDKEDVLFRSITAGELGTFAVSGRQYQLDLAGRAVESKSLLTPVERHPEMKISREGDMVFFKADSLTSAVQNQTDNTNRIKSDASNISGWKSTPQRQGSKRRSKTRIKRRSKRGIPSGTDIVEMLIYTDEIMCNRFITLKNSDRTAGLEATRFFYALLVNEMDQVYQGFQDHPSNNARLDIRLSFNGIIIACDSAGAPWSTDRSNASIDLSDFATWQNNLKMQLNLKYDIAMGISGKIKGSVSSTILGIGYAQAICNPQFGVNIIYDTKFSTWLMTTATHELGHNLGADHDQSRGCSSGFLMSTSAFTANASTASTQYEFTSCAIDAIERIITRQGSTRCTLNHNFNDAEYDQYRAGAIGGDVLSLDYQCQVYYGSGSFACLKNNATMCYKGVTCQSSSGCKGRLHLVKEHTECDTNKWCSKGQCVDKSTSGTDIPGVCFVHTICTRINKQLIGDACCQGFSTISCCTPDKRQTSCFVDIPC